MSGGREGLEKCHIGRVIDYILNNGVVQVDECAELVGVGEALRCVAWRGVEEDIAK